MTYLEEGEILELVLEVGQGVHARQEAPRSSHAHIQEGVHAWGQPPRMWPGPPCCHLLHLGLQ